MRSHYIIKEQGSALGYMPIQKNEYVEAILSIAKKQGVKITNGMIKEEIEKKKKNTKKEKGAWDAKKRKKLLKALEDVRGIWADDKDFEKRQKKRDELELEAAKEMKKAW